MPNDKEVDELVGDTTAVTEESDTVSRDEYEKLAKSYENHRSLENRRDKELSELREKVKMYESKPAKAAATDDGEEEDDEETRLLQRLEKLGIKPRTEEEIKDEVRKTLKLEDKTKEIISKVSEIREQHPFVKESEFLSFLTRNPDFTYEKALKALYPDEMAALAKGKTAEDSVVETDNGGRTLRTRSEQVQENTAPQKRGIPKGSDFADWIMGRANEVASKEAGIR